MKIFAIGMNYLQHTAELDGSAYKPEAPVIFTKADSALLKDHKPFFIPDWSKQVDYETEIVVRICRLGKGIPERFAHRYYDAVGMPWDLFKGFDGSAAIGEWIPKEKFLDVQALHFHLDINGKTVQQGCTSDMVYKIDEIVSYISRFFTLKTGDMIYTGTPVGIGPVHIDDHLEGYIEERKVLEFNCK